MNTNKPLSIFLVAILAASVFSVVGITSMPLKTVSAQAQDVTIETSADELGGTFFGHGVLQVVIEDENADDDDGNEDEVITVTVEIDGATTVEEEFDIPDTRDGSQRFEFFIAHEDSVFATAQIGDLDPIGDAAGAYSGATNEYTPVITWGPTGDIAVADTLFDEITVTIEYDGQVATADYEEVDAQLQLDRDVYGSENLIYLRIIDQDANLNPTESDSFDISLDDMNAELFDVEGGDFADTDPFTFEETGDNTGIFEAEVLLATEFIVDTGEETVQMTLNDQAHYDESIGGIVLNDETNDSTATDEFSFEIDDSDGEVDDIADPTFSSELVIVVRDNDQNIDSEEEDTISGALVVEVVGGDSETVDLTETGDNTGVFEFDLSNSELRITFLDDTLSGAEFPAAMKNNGILELRAEDIEEDIVVEYNDPLADNSAPDLVASFTLQMMLTPGQVSAPTEVGVTDEFIVTITDPDLNDNSRLRDSYTIVFDDTGPYPITRGGLEFGAIYTVDLELDGDALDFVTPVTVTMRETGVNTGIFEFEIDVEDITDNAEVGGDPVTISDGDDLEISIEDFMADTTDAEEDDATVTIGKPSAGVDFSRTNVPIPPTPGSAVEAEVGTSVVTRLILTDPTLGTQTNVQELVDFVFGTDEGEWTIEVDGDDVNSLTIDSLTDFFGDDEDQCDAGADDGEAEIVSGVALCEVMGIDDDGDLLDFLEETGPNTGVFEADLEFTGHADMDASKWQDAEFTFTYTNDEEDEESGGFTFRGSDGIVTVDQPSATTGTILTITVEDQDLNLDDEEIDSFESAVEATGLFVLAVETEDDDIPHTFTEDFEETGEDTGIFTARFVIGDDIPIVDTVEGDQATNVLITYNDEVDSTGGGGDEMEVNVPVVSSTGSIQVTPELVGPATTLTVLIIDADLDEDASSTDEHRSDDVGDMVEFASSRNEVDEASPHIEETGPNTGVFMFELELITDEEACADDDLSDPEFEATGDSTDASIGACPGDLISIRYEDERTGSGGGNTVSVVVEVASWDPEFVADKESYNVGDRVTVTISDPDANRDPDIADTLTDIRVTSDSDRVGEEFSAIETGRDTGVFRLSFGTTSGTAGGAISVNQGDDITVRYTDQFPADFVDEEEGKDFDFVVSVSGDVGDDATTVTPPTLQDVTGQEIDEVSARQQVVLATSVRNNNAQAQPFVALIEVRDDAGVTVFLAWQTGTLPASGQTQVGLSWTPDVSGDYEVRTFVISDLNNPRVLSPVSTSNVTVN